MTLTVASETALALRELEQADAQATALESRLDRTLTFLLSKKWRNIERVCVEADFIAGIGLDATLDALLQGLESEDLGPAHDPVQAPASVRERVDVASNSQTNISSNGQGEISSNEQEDGSSNDEKKKLSDECARERKEQEAILDMME